MKEYEQIAILKREVADMKADFSRFKRAVLNVPGLGDKVQKKLWEF
jgi:hypothetical protein